jgi:hypothetical protein
LETQEKLIKLLDDYYGDSRNISHKEEVANFVENYYEDIKVIMEE